MSAVMFPEPQPIQFYQVQLVPLDDVNPEDFAT